MDAPKNDPEDHTAGPPGGARLPLRTRAGFRAAAMVVCPSLDLLISRRWQGVEKLPPGGFIGVANHVTEFDPLVIAHSVYRTGRTPHFLAKDSLFRIPAIGRILHGLRQVPVARGTRGGGASLEAAHNALRHGGAVIVYPEGTLTRDPELWPMRGKTGAARLALKTGYPVVPITQWGVQDLMGSYAKTLRPFPRKRYALRFGDPLDFDDLRTGPITRSRLLEATTRIETALTEGVAALRGQKPPEQIWDREKGGYVPRRPAPEAPADQQEAGA